MKLMMYLNKRGGRIILTDIRAPDRSEWGTPEDAMMAALGLEKEVNEVRNGINLNLLLISYFIKKYMNLIKVHV
jgi:Ferritin-like protein